MNSRYFITTDSLCSSRVVVPLPTIATEVVEETMDVNVRNMSSSRTPLSSFLIRMAIRISRSRCFSFLRRVFHYQNGSRSELGSNPFNSVIWMMMECIALSIQIIVTTYTLAISKEERPVWPMRIWVFGYSFGCVLSLILLYWRYWALYIRQRDDSDIEQQINHDESRALPPLLERCRTCIELFFAIWFVMGNVWVFDSRFGSFHRAPKLHVLCISLLAWNAVTYSFPFILFVLLCCCVPLLSSLLGYNMNMGSLHRGASDEQLSNLPSWKYNEIGNKQEFQTSAIDNENAECCICLVKYRDKEEIRQLPCSHIFHLKCVDQWLRIISCCPLCKQELER
ncbi:PREDICTED: E3 ubiquitin-protein ligase At1g63170-like [Nicotiana attenuata]|uniref:E3 ubiquitin-protein ligase n=1 Tax=Nicotiana attenuata TaxID=49451 RepID=A0A1J6I6C7_NICAT|nr:PREDICTED: E3 ubiquitin-protein ligase At1g63170-like [Nicotiana attenuata]OIT00558.1 e3 ubiquitin-protein ligase [Nicotiana attenuata]